MAEEKKNENGSSIKELFQTFSGSDNKDSGSQSVSFSCIQNWLKGASVLGQDKKIPEEETSSMLSKYAKTAKDSLNMEEFQQFMDELAGKMKMNANDLVSSMKNVGTSAGSEKKGIIDNIKNLAGFKKE